MQPFFHFTYILCSPAQMYSEINYSERMRFFYIPKLCSTKRHKRLFLAYYIIDFLTLGHIFHQHFGASYNIPSIPPGGNFQTKFSQNVLDNKTCILCNGNHYYVLNYCFLHLLSMNTNLCDAYTQVITYRGTGLFYTFNHMKNYFKKHPRLGNFLICLPFRSP